MAGKPHNLNPWFPAVPVQESVRDKEVVCLECGKAMVLMKRHLWFEHGLEEDDYRRRWNLAADQPLAAPAYTRAKEATRRKN